LFGAFVDEIWWIAGAVWWFHLLLWSFDVGYAAWACHLAVPLGTDFVIWPCGAA